MFVSVSGVSYMILGVVSVVVRIVFLEKNFVSGGIFVSVKVVMLKVVSISGCVWFVFVFVFMLVLL